MSKCSRTSIVACLQKNPACGSMTNPLHLLPHLPINLSTMLLNCILIAHNPLGRPQGALSERSKSGQCRVIVCGSYVNNEFKSLRQ